ncbi:hypothetical protein HMI56_002429, partial [Coelomomyces lativittatus]
KNEKIETPEICSHLKDQNSTTKSFFSQIRSSFSNGISSNAFLGTFSNFQTKNAITINTDIEAWPELFQLSLLSQFMLPDVFHSESYHIFSLKGENIKVALLDVGIDWRRSEFVIPGLKCDKWGDIGCRVIQQWGR